MTFSRVRALIFVAALFITAGTVVIMAISRDTQTRTAAPTACPPGMVPAKIDLPEREDVIINLFNGTKVVGTADRVATELKYRKFQVKKVAAAPKAIGGIATITYGPEAVGAAWLVSANFLVDEAEMDFDIERKGPEVDVVLGTDFLQLASPTEVNQSIAANGRPLLPPGTCKM